MSGLFRNVPTPSRTIMKKNTASGIQSVRNLPQALSLCKRLVAWQNTLNGIIQLEPSVFN